ncbi:phosphotransacetylase [Hypnocyclicus thermotrophus]|uniref:Phosphate acetyltransferase n=1 Tax=Hypnocyclicus thermotrophus TaxID=1627895 RepID=A0AA46I5J5_9FUSO|nr:phosphate acetyltransferase [Hypnocyclicus thermotrophus]TDT70492.1 phosphotransacetylase [Hypnocyclicus thermotrophus]
MGIIEQIRSKAKAELKTIVLPETNDERVVKAAAKVLEEKLAKLILIGEETTIKSKASELNINIEGAEIVNPKNYSKLDKYIAEFVKLREKKGMTEQIARQVLENDPRFFGAMMVRMGDADGMVAGSDSPTADVLRAAIQVIGTKPGLRTVSSCFVMVLPKESEPAKLYGKDGVLIFSDCGVVPNPTPEQLADIATSAAASARSIVGMEPKVALLSFSTKGSAKHEDVDKVIEAGEILKNRAVNFEFEEELQADAAIVPAIASKKAPDSKVAGKANVLVFPDLSAGNIGYKLVQRLANADAYGPLLQGLAKPVNDLSRGCSVQDIVDIVAITSAQAE